MLKNKKNWLIFSAILVLGFLVFGNSLNGEFVHDDLLVLSHSFFNDSAKIFRFFGQPYFEGVPEAGLYRPLTQFSFGINYLFSASPAGFHLINIILHILNSFLVFLLIRRLVKSDRISLIAALLFLILPIHVEAVASIVGRAELLSFFFGILAILFWVDSRYIYSASALFLALLAKETAIAVPAIIFLLGWSRNVHPVTHPNGRYGIHSYALPDRHYKRNWRWLTWHIGAVGLYFVMRFAVLGKYFLKTNVEFVFNPLAYVPFHERIFTALKILALYLQKIFAPYNLSADYSYDQIPVVNNLFSSPLAIAGLIILGLMTWIVFRILQNKKGSIFTWASVFFLMPFLVISNLLTPIGTIMGERLMYFPSLGAVIIMAFALDYIFKFSKKLGLAALLVLLGLYSFLTINQNKIWLSREALLTDSFQKSPNSIVAKTNYGILVLGSEKELARQLSLEVYDKYPDYIQNLNLRAAVETQAGNFVEAEKFLEQALKIRPKHQNTLQNISRIYFTLGKYKEAEAVLKILALEYGGNGNVIFYALVQSENGHFDEARQTIYNFFGPNVTDESALKIINGHYKEMESFYIL